MKHTEGPWVAKHWGNYSCVLTEGNDTVAMQITNEADARLIAAAPEMAALLRGYLKIEDGEVWADLDVKTKALLAELEEHES